MSGAQEESRRPSPLSNLGIRSIGLDRSVELLWLGRCLEVDCARLVSTKKGNRNMGRMAESNDRWGVCASAGSRIDRGWAEPRRRVAESSREGSSRRRDRRGPEGGDGRRARRSRGRDALAYYLVAGVDNAAVGQETRASMRPKRYKVCVDGAGR